jgi:hypothetical protein
VQLEFWLDRLCQLHRTKWSMQVLIEEECMRKRVVWAPKELMM